MNRAALLGWMLCITAGAQASMVYTQGGQVFVADEDGAHAKSVTAGPLRHYQPDLDPSGRFVVYSEGESESSTKLILHDLETGVRTYVPGESFPRISGNGRFLVAVTEGGLRITVADLTGKLPLESFDSQSTLISPVIASDGSFVVFERDRDETHHDILIYDVKEKRMERVSPSNGRAESPALSADNRFIVYREFDGARWDLVIFDRKSGEASRLTESDAEERAPVFRPDGSLVFGENSSGKFQLHFISAAEFGNQTYKVKPFLEAESEIEFARFSGDVRFAQALLPSALETTRVGFAAIRRGLRIYVVGGNYGDEVSARADYYDLESRTWVAIEPRPVAARGFAVYATEKFLYAFGGDTGTQSLDQIDRYDFQTNDWKTVGRLNARRANYGLAAVKGKVYLLGGWDTTTEKLLDSVEAFDPETELATVMPYVVPAPLRRDFTAVTSGNEIFLLGGISSTLPALNSVTAINPVNGRNRELSPLPQATVAPAVADVDRHLFVFGGKVRTGKESFEDTDDIYSLALFSSCAPWVHSGRYLARNRGRTSLVDLAPQRWALVDKNGEIETFSIKSSP